MEDKVTVNDVTIQRGDVIRLFDGAFNDAVVLGFRLSNGHWYAELARPYLYASAILGTPLMGYEHMKMLSVKSIIDYYTIIEKDGSRTT